MNVLCWLTNRLHSLPAHPLLADACTGSSYRFFPRLRLFRRDRFPDRHRLRLVLEALEERWTPSVVSSLTDDSTDPNFTNSLRYAVTHAVVGDTISFDSSLQGHTINLTSTLTLSSNLTI
jgi:hypothetical protein